MTPTKALWEGVVIALAVALAACGAQLLVTRGNLASVRLDLANKIAAWNAERASLEQAGRQAEAQYRAQETAWSNAVQEQQRALLAEQRRSARFAADLRAARLSADSLREPIATFADGGGAADDTLAACRDRAAALGALLDEAMHVGEACAADGEGESAKLRSVLGSWPVR